MIGDYSSIVVSRTFPEGAVQWDFEFPFVEYKNIVITPDELYLVCYGYEKQRNHIYVHAVKNGELVHKIPIKYAGFKEVLKIVALPDKPSVVALIDVDKGNLMDIMQQKYLKSIPAWDGTCSKVVFFSRKVSYCLTFQGWSIRSVCSCNRRDGDAGPANWPSMQDSDP